MVFEKGQRAMQEFLLVTEIFWLIVVTVMRASIYEGHYGKQFNTFHYASALVS